MSKLFKLNQRLKSISEIEGIFKTLKTIAFTELQRSQQFVKSMHNMSHELHKIEASIASMLVKRKLSIGSKDIVVPIYIGSERGFCGPFNRYIAERFSHDLRSSKSIIVGSKLNSLVDEDQGSYEFITGAETSEDITQVALAIVSQFTSIIGSEQNALPKFQMIHMTQTEDKFNVISEDILRDFLVVSDQKNTQPDSFLNRDELFLGFLNTYLYSKIMASLVESFVTECKYRVYQSDGAITALETKRNKVDRLIKKYRQENITEEIENILLSQN